MTAPASTFQGTLGKEYSPISIGWGGGLKEESAPTKYHGSLSPLNLCLCLYPKEEDVVIEDFEEDSEAEGSGGEDDIRELRAKKLALARKIAEQQRRQEKIQVKPNWRS